MKTWPLQDAKSRFSEVVHQAQAGEAQVVTKHGKEAAVVLGYEQYLELLNRQRSALDSFRSAPDLSALELKRDATPVRTIDLD